MSTTRRKKLLRAGLILSLICLAGSAVMLTQPLTGSYGRIAMTGTMIVAILTGLSFFLQLRQKDPK